MEAAQHVGRARPQHRRPHPHGLGHRIEHRGGQALQRPSHRRLVDRQQAHPQALEAAHLLFGVADLVVIVIVVVIVVVVVLRRVGGGGVRHAFFRVSANGPDAP